jgi:hypothetical protein
MQMAATAAKPMNDTVNPRLIAAEYAVRGAITERAAEIEKILASGKGSLPFDKVLYCNIGNPQQLNQKPISYFRQLLACCECPEVRDRTNLLDKFLKVLNTGRSRTWRAKARRELCRRLKKTSLQRVALCRANDILAHGCNCTCT